MAATPPRILLPTDRENDSTPGSSDPEPRPAIEYFLAPAGEPAREALRVWHDERARRMQIGKLEIVQVGGVPHLFTFACSPEFVSAQWAVGMSIEIGNAKAAQVAQAQVQQMVQAAPAGLSMPPPSDPRHRRPRR